VRMCGRFARTTPPEELAALVDAEPVTGLRPRYNLAPTQDALVARARHGVAGRELVQLRWGLVPHWAKDAKGAARMINARAETAGAKLAFRDAFRQRRCLVAADGWYEWRTTAAGRAPMLIQRLGPGGEVTPFFFAGLWARWRNPAAPDAPPL